MSVSPDMSGRGESDQHFGSALYRIGIAADLLRLASRRDIENMKPLIHPEMESLPTPGIAPQPSRPGREGFLDYFRDTKAKGILMEADAYEIHACHSGKVLIAGSLRFTTHGRTTESPLYFVYTFRDGLISRAETHTTREAAEAAAGSMDLETRSASTD